MTIVHSSDVTEADKVTNPFTPSPGDLKVQASSSSKCVSPAVNRSPGKKAWATVPPGPSKG